MLPLPGPVLGHLQMLGAQGRLLWPTSEISRHYFLSGLSNYHALKEIFSQNNLSTYSHEYNRKYALNLKIIRKFSTIVWSWLSAVQKNADLRPRTAVSRTERYAGKRWVKAERCLALKFFGQCYIVIVMLFSWIISKVKLRFGRKNVGVSRILLSQHKWQNLVFYNPETRWNWVIRTNKRTFLGCHMKWFFSFNDKCKGSNIPITPAWP